MEALEDIKLRIEASVPGVQLQIISNPGPTKQASLLVDVAHARAVAQFLRDDPKLALDYVTSVTGVDYLDKVLKEKVRSKELAHGVEHEVEQVVERTVPGYLEAVYHLYSMGLKQGPLILRQRTENRTDKTQVASLTSVFRGAEFQEREAYDLYGIVFEGHPDLRRILMWEGFKDFPMRKDYHPPDDYEWEPTPHDEIVERVKEHQAKEGRGGNA